VGAAVGFLHRPMLRAARSRGWSIGAGAAGMAVLVACGAAQYGSARTERLAPPPGPTAGEAYRRAVTSLGRLTQIDGLYRTLATGSPPEPPGRSRPGVVPPRAALIEGLQRSWRELDSARMPLRSDEEARAYAAVGRAIGGLGGRRPAPGEVVAFERDLNVLKRRALEDVLRNQAAVKGTPRPSPPRRRGG
jgi:hypothetical protein